MDTTLPYNSELDISALSRLFANTTNSYKYVFFISYLDILKRRDFNVSSPISFQEMIVEMLATAWYPHSYFKLSFGLQDKITTLLDSLKLDISQPILKFTDIDKKLLRGTLNQQMLDNSLMQYVPYRLLRPFFEDEVRRLPDYRINAEIARLATEMFTSRKPLYQFNETQDQLIPHPDWVSYFKQHFSIIKGWTAWNWLGYMQRCNQGVPALSSKLFVPQQRDSLKTQIEYWKLVLKHSEVLCIYTNEKLSADRISIDHYLPWSFVAHDQLWNLIPTSPEVNSSKSNCLPANSYFDRFVVLQHHGLTITNQHAEARKWEKYVEPFVADLRLNDRYDLLDQNKLKRAYEANLKPLLELAKTLGFSPNWHYRHYSL